jgi:hypothetical protein
MTFDKFCDDQSITQQQFLNIINENKDPKQLIAILQETFNVLISPKQVIDIFSTMPDFDTVYENFGKISYILRKERKSCI